MLMHDTPVRYQQAARPALPTIAFAAYLVFFVLCLLLGGGTRQGFLADAVLQLLAIPLIAYIALKGLARPTWVVIGAVGLIAVVQLTPLPAEIWRWLPMRAGLEIDIAGVGSDTWRAISISPQRTLESLLSLLPAMAIFSTTLLLTQHQRRVVTVILLLVGLLSAALGLIQVAEGPDSALRFFTVTNRTEAVGFFANRNHFAGLAYAVLVMALAWLVALVDAHGRGRPGREQLAGLLMALGSGVLLILAALIMARSRAGFGLAIGALVAGLFLATKAGFRVRTLLLWGAAPCVLALGVLLAYGAGTVRLAEKLLADPLADARLIFARTTVEAAWANMPVGSGLGTFVTAYAMFEKPQGLMEAYVNRAHSDVLELWLELGVLAPVLVLGFLVWSVARTWAVWRAAALNDGVIDITLQRAAGVVIFLLLVHSLVDYPLRTTALMCVMAFCCALLIAPVGVRTKDRP